MYTHQFEPRRAIRRVAIVLIGMAALVFLFGCPNLALPAGGDAAGTAPKPGSVTVALTGAAEVNGNILYAFAYDKGEWRINMAPYVRGAGQASIASGTAQCVLKDSVDTNWEPAGESWTASAGAEYDLYVYVLDASTGDMVSIIEPWPTTPGAIDGNKTVTVDYSQLTAYAPTSGTLSVGLTGASEYAGKTIYIGVLPRGVDPMANEPLADGSAVISPQGTASMTAQTVPGGGNWIGSGDAEYDVYAFIDMDGNGEANGPNNGDLLHSPAPVIYWQYGDAVMPTLASDYLVYSSE